MGQLLLLLVVALTVAAVVFGVTVLVGGRDPGLAPTEPDSQAVPLPGTRPLRESDVGAVRFDTGLRGYRMAQVDQAMRRAAYDIGYKSELIGVLEAEVIALREGRTDDADVLRRAREQSAGAAPDATAVEPAATSSAADADGVAPATDQAVDADGVTPTTSSAVDADGVAPATSSVADADGVAPATSSAADADGVAPAADDASVRTPADDAPTGASRGAGQQGAVVRSESA
ncbi:DivIVA domain-containing protein [Micromonospora sp. NPDC005979]|uniref:DivIVA domain-containing protein n=1 Tax=Micromonospora sp. NPDC005979 TaxID=3156726 RepID=UPI0033B631F3